MRRSLRTGLAAGFATAALVTASLLAAAPANAAVVPPGCRLSLTPVSAAGYCPTSVPGTGYGMTVYCTYKGKTRAIGNGATQGNPISVSCASFGPSHRVSNVTMYTY